MQAGKTEQGETSDEILEANHQNLLQNRMLTRNFYLKLEETKAQISQNFAYAERKRKEEAVQLVSSIQEEYRQWRDQFVESMNEFIETKLQTIKNFDIQVNGELEKFRIKKLDELMDEVCVIEKRQRDIDRFASRLNYREPVELDVGG